VKDQGKNHSGNFSTLFHCADANLREAREAHSKDRKSASYLELCAKSLALLENVYKSPDASKEQKQAAYVKAIIVFGAIDDFLGKEKGTTYSSVGHNFTQK